MYKLINYLPLQIYLFGEVKGQIKKNKQTKNNNNKSAPRSR